MAESRDSYDEDFLLRLMEEQNKMIQESNSPVLRRAKTTADSSLESASTSTFSSFFFGGQPEVEEKAKSDDEIFESWGVIANDYDKDPKKMKSESQRIIVDGIPNVFRGIIWPLLADTIHSPLKNWYATTIEQRSPHEKQIKRDLDRTFPTHPLFTQGGLGQETMFKVIKAYSLYDPEMGYCQGIAFIVGLLLMQMPEEDCFAAFVCLMEKFKMRKLFLKGMPLVGLSHFQLYNLIHDHLPNLSAHLDREGVELSSFVTPWLLTIFSQTMPLPIVFHILDYIFAYGEEYPMGALHLLYQAILCILKDIEEDLLTRNHDDIMHYLKNEIQCLYTAESSQAGSELYSANELSRELLAATIEVKISQKRLKQLEKAHEEERINREKRSDRLTQLTEQNLALESKNKELLLEVKALKSTLQDLTDSMEADVKKRIEQLEKSDFTIEILRKENADLLTQLEEQNATSASLTLALSDDCLLMRRSSSINSLYDAKYPSMGSSRASRESHNDIRIIRDEHIDMSEEMFVD